MKTALLLLALIALSQAEIQHCNCQPNSDGTDTQGLHPDTYECVDPQVPNCEVAVNDDASKCQTCNSGYYPEDDENCTEVTGDDVVEECLRYDANKACIGCNENFTLHTNTDDDVQTCVANSEVDGCASWEATSDTETNCIGCESGYRFVEDDNSCEACTEDNCTACPADKDTCTQCDSANGYFLNEDDDTCIQPDVSGGGDTADIDHCTSYGGTELDECYSCEEGYYVNEDNTECIEYSIDDCYTQTDAETCTACTGSSNKYPNSDGTECSEDVADGDVVENCEYYGSDGKCGTCQDGKGEDADGDCTIDCPEATTGGNGGSDSTILRVILPVIMIIASLILF